MGWRRSVSGTIGQGRPRCDHDEHFIDEDRGLLSVQLLHSPVEVGLGEGFDLRFVELVVVDQL